MIKISVIVPVYNVENYLRECLESIINQTLKEIEILCIDDCSTDNSYSILEEYAKKDNRIILIKNLENKGGGYNRNIGIKEARGEYISFIDSDDYILKDYLENLYNTAKKYNSDIVNTLNIKTYIEETKKTYKFDFNFKNEEFESEWNLRDIENLSSYNSVAPYVWNKLYKKSFLLNNKIYFLEYKVSTAEDADFTIRLMAHKPRISFNNKSIYFYRKHQTSLTSTVDKGVESATNAINHLSNALLYYTENFPNFLPEVSFKLWVPVINFFNASSFSDKFKLFDYIKSFSKKIFIDPKFVNMESTYEYSRYIAYLIIRASENYDKYLLYTNLYSDISLIKGDINRSSNWFRLFGINNTKEYLTIILFGIKISIKKI